MNALTDLALPTDQLRADTQTSFVGWQGDPSLPEQLDHRSCDTQTALVELLGEAIPSHGIMYSALALDSVEAARIACGNRAFQALGGARAGVEMGKLTAAFVATEVAARRNAKTGKPFAPIENVTDALRSLDKLPADWLPHAEMRATLGEVSLSKFTASMGADMQAVYEAIAAWRHLAAQESDLVVSLERAVRAHPLNAWIQSTQGVGLKQVGRLIAAVGDPYWNDKHDRPRLVSELWRYCGLDPVDGVGRKRTKGERLGFSMTARKRAWLVAKSCVRAVESDGSEGKRSARDASPYRVPYLAAKAHHQGAIHQHPCSQCGVCATCGRSLDLNQRLHTEAKGCTRRVILHAEIGSPLSDGHIDGRAIRVVMKLILRDLWAASRSVHQGSNLLAADQGHLTPDAQFHRALVGGDQFSCTDQGQASADAQLPPALVGAGATSQ